MTSDSRSSSNVSDLSSGILHAGVSHQLDHADISVPSAVQEWVRMTKVSEKKVKYPLFRIDPDEGQVLVESKKEKGVKIIPIECIKELRFATDASYYRTQFSFPAETETRWMTIIYIMEGSYKILHIVTPSVQVFGLWKESLEKLFTIRQGLMSGLQNNVLRDAVWEKQYWKGADHDGDQKLEFSELRKLCQRLSLHFSVEELTQLFEEADIRNRDYLDYDDFKRFVKLLKRRPEVEQLYQKICGGKFDLPAFRAFMRNYQKTQLSDEELQDLFTKYADSSSSVDSQPATNSSTAPAESDKKAVPLISLDSFSNFLKSSDNCAFAAQNSSVFHDMTRPMSEYFVSSSHNTYLIGHQLVGVSTIEGYIRALLHSCRTVELDIYDGQDEPVVYHGKTLTSKVSVREVCQAIAKYAFVASPYPVVISAEVHCSVQQQDMIVDIMGQAFGDALIRAPVEGRPKLPCLPSPENLKGKVLLKAKNLYVAAQLDALRAESKAKPKDQTGVKEQRKLDVDVSSSSSSSSSDSSIISEIKGIKDKLRNKVKHKRGGKQKTQMSFSLASLLVYTVGVKCHGINSSVHYAPEHIFSLSENSANKLLKASTDLIKHTQSHMVRVYPKGTRVNSSNYEPHMYWAAGAQVVAINWQTFDLGYMINHAMFQRNGRSGYVLKPPALRPGNEALLRKFTKHLLDLTIISAQQLPLPKNKAGQEILDKAVVDPLVEVSLHIPLWSKSPFIPSKAGAVGVEYSGPNRASASEPTSARTVSFRTGSVKNNGFNPVWQEELCLPFDCVGGMMDLIFIKFSVMQEKKDDKNDEPLAVYCAPLGSLEHGFRYLPLHDSQLSQHLFSTLFVEIKIRDVVT